MHGRKKVAKLNDLRRKFFREYIINLNLTYKTDKLRSYKIIYSLIKYQSNGKLVTEVKKWG